MEENLFPSTGDNIQIEQMDYSKPDMDDVPKELENLAWKLSDEERMKIANRVISDYRTDLESRSQWVKMHDKWLKLYHQTDKPVNGPWEGSSSESIPMVAEACTQFHSRSMKMMFKHRDIIRAVPTANIETKDIERAERVSKHMNFQLMVKDKTYRRNKDRLMLAVALHGSMFTKTYYCPIRERNVVENVNPIDLVVPYGVGPRDIEELERKTHVIHETVNNTRIKAKQGFFLCPASPDHVDDDKNEYRSTVDKVEGIEDPNASANSKCIILEQHRLISLDGEDIEKPYIVWVDLNSEKLLRIAPRYSINETTKEMPSKDPETGAPLLGPDNEPLMHEQDVEEIDYTPVEYFTHYCFIENPDGFYGLGYGHLIGDMNSSVNKILRQSIDAGTLASTTTGFISKSLGMRKGEVEVQLGKYTPVDASTDDIRKAIMTLNHQGPNAELLAMMRLLMERGDRLATVTEALTGSTNKVMQPNTVDQLIEQGLTLYTATMDRILAAWNCELDKIFRLNSKYLDDAEYFAIFDASIGFEQAHVLRDDYKGDLQITPTADPNMITEQQKLKKAEMEFGILSKIPFVQQSPKHAREVIVRFLKAIDVKDIDSVLPSEQEIMQFAQQQAQQPNPEVEKAQADMQIKQQDSQLKMQLKEAETRHKLEMEQLKTEAQIAIEQVKAEEEMKNATTKSMLDNALKALEQMKRSNDGQE